MRTAVLAASLLIATPVFALDATCETYLAAAEKSAQQSARHTVTQPGDGSTYEAIVIGSSYFAKMEGAWQLLKGSPGLKGELKLIESIRSGKYAMTGCRKTGSETFEGVATQVITFTLDIPGISAEPTRAFIGRDGLVYGQISGKTRVSHRYVGVKAPI